MKFKKVYIEITNRCNLKCDFCLGNIYFDDFNNIINSKRVSDMIGGFKNNFKCEELCKHCGFLDN